MPKLNCPNCSRKIKVPARLVSGSGQCPKCGAELVYRDGLSVTRAAPLEPEFDLNPSPAVVMRRESPSVIIGFIGVATILTIWLTLKLSLDGQRVTALKEEKAAQKKIMDLKARD